MSYNNSDREFFYSLYSKLYKSKIEEILSVKLGEIELDKNIEGRKVDIYSVAESGSEVFIELQLSQSDNVHLAQILNIIDNDNTGNCIIAWGALEFKNYMLDDIEAQIKSLNKNIRFIALRLNEKLLNYLHILYCMFITQVIDNLKILNEVDNHFEIIENFYRLQDKNNTTTYSKKVEEPLDLNNKQNVMKYLFNELRKQIYYYPSIHRDKKLDNNVIVLAGGKAEVSYFIGINRKNMLFVELRFGEIAKDIFNELLKKEEEINDILDFMIEFDAVNHKIGTHIYFANKNRELLIKRIARITDKYIKYFSQYTFSNTTG